MNNQTSYKQDIKEKSRIEIWTIAINKLTIQREQQRILNPNYIRRLWDYAFDEVLTNRNPNENFIEGWIDFSNNLYESKQPQQLKIAYFCGPEPENDLSIMIRLGIRIENVWAIESDKSTYNLALYSAKKKYPTLKIFNGSIADLLKITSFKFDIIYLDFTATLFSKNSRPLLTINSVFETDSLNDLGILIINSTLPDNKEENVDFLASYFKSHPFFEADILYGEQENTWFTEGADASGVIDKQTYEISKSEGYIDEIKDSPIFEELIKSNFEAAYSAFSSHYPIIAAGYIQPMLRIASNPALKRMLLKVDDLQIQQCLDKMATPINYEAIEQKYDIVKCLKDRDNFPIELSGGEIFENHMEFPIWNFILRLKNSNHSLNKYWYQQFSTNNSMVSILKSVQLYDLLRNAQNSYQDILSETLSQSINLVIKALPDPNGGIFCDVPLPHLWIELALNHIGNAYHINTDMHWRAKYQAKTRVMFLDLFVFDNCRALYNWLPMINLYGQDMKSIERQIIVRSCMDAITKQNHYSSYYSYYGANLIGEGSKRWSKFGKLNKRNNLNV